MKTVYKILLILILLLILINLFIVKNKANNTKNSISELQLIARAINRGSKRRKL